MTCKQLHEFRWNAQRAGTLHGAIRVRRPPFDVWRMARWRGREGQTSVLRLVPRHTWKMTPNSPLTVTNIHDSHSIVCAQLARIWDGAANLEVNSGLNYAVDFGCIVSTWQISRDIQQHSHESRFFHPHIFLFAVERNGRQAIMEDTGSFRNCWFRLSAARENRFCWDVAFRRNTCSFAGIMFQKCRRPRGADAKTQWSRKPFLGESRMDQESCLSLHNGKRSTN